MSGQKFTANESCGEKYEAYTSPLEWGHENNCQLPVKMTALDILDSNLWTNICHSFISTDTWNFNTHFD